MASPSEISIRTDIGQERISWIIRVGLVLFIAALKLSSFYLTYHVYGLIPYTRYVDIETSWDGAIPYLNWSWTVYYFGFAYIVFWGAAGIWSLSRQALRRTICIYSLLVLAGAAVHLMIPTRAPWPLIQNMSAVQNSFRTTYSIEPLACFPSMHVAMAVLPAFISLYVFRSRLNRIISVILALMVSASVVTAKEHWLLDVVSGLALGFLACAAWKIYVHNPEERLKQAAVRMRSCVPVSGGYKLIIMVLASGLIFAGAGRCETALRSDRVQGIWNMVWQNKFASAFDSSRQIMQQEPSNPLGYFLVGAIYYNISNQFRSDRFEDSIAYYLDTSIALAEKTIKSGRKEAGMYFILGSAYGCRALNRAIHGGRWGAFKDGQHSCSNLEKAFDLDTTLDDALYGIGAYHYWKSVKLKKLTWLPFISNKRKQGLAELLQAANKGTVMSLDAWKTLLPVYLNEKRYEEVVRIADSLITIDSEDANCLLHLVRGLIVLERWDEAEAALARLQRVWDNSSYSDGCGSREALYLRAKILKGKGDAIGVRACLEQILSAEKECNGNAYFRETMSNAKELRR